MNAALYGMNTGWNCQDFITEENSIYLPDNVKVLMTKVSIKRL